LLLLMMIMLVKTNRPPPLMLLLLLLKRRLLLTLHAAVVAANLRAWLIHSWLGPAGLLLLYWTLRFQALPCYPLLLWLCRGHRLQLLLATV
jgi:hypothetical protein